ncbi:type II CRISPR RNA-guided endonuclease Cas9 [Dysgonomonas macrotermitis]|uniref:CRISPR-associated endonuclease Cas9 n=1 Tax=Dysgonomonas macrotermitis TaxID=1346286 RepID=A0A1M5JWT1_9BACT|nr:type II CRISPR RNA-guided endonuclease Cas9 [Dysgonomonas macrotermitis]SHG45004.1 CRISPR-associated endonuclease Csn1 [Dysgonomonas macrotermitis]
MKKILGLDLGTNSIGWALVDKDAQKILGMGSRIIPMSQDVLGNFDKGNSVSQTAERTGFRGTRRLRERHLLRRERLHRILHILGFLPEHYKKYIDFEKRLGQFVNETEPKLAYNNCDFLFKKSFEEMVADFRQQNPSMFYTKSNGKETKIPYDWTIYYLRKKALTQKIEKEELAWIILNFNQKRGYYQLRGEEEEENPNKLVEFHSLKIIEVEADEKPNSKGDTWYSLQLENGWIYRRSSKNPLFDWKDKIRDFIVTTDLNDDGTVKIDKEGNERRSFRAPSEDDWTLLKKKTEAEIEYSRKTVGTYIYENLLSNPNQKIRGKLVRTIERKFYKEELIAILKKQIELQPELFSDDLYNDCVRELYRSNEAHQFILSKKDFVHLFINDIIFYQRPLKSQKSSISNCSLEFRKYKDKDGNEVKEYLKAIPKSHPLYQEFRLWQWIYNLKIYRKDVDSDLTSQFITSVNDQKNLFDFLNSRKEIDQKALLKYFKLSEKTHRWNFVEDKTYPCNETGAQIKTRLAKVEKLPADFLTAQTELGLWHIIYSVTDKKEYEQALSSFARKYYLNETSFVENFKKFPPFKSEYGTYSEKAIKKLLPLMRLGEYWNWDAIDIKTKGRIDKILTGEYDTDIKDRVREKAINLIYENDFQGLQLWLAQYIVYDRHSEANDAVYWKTPQDIDNYLKEFKQHSLRNPIVEQVITETLRVVRDIWKKFGDISEIHIELGREMKKTAKERERLTSQMTENENTNLRIKALLIELKENSDGKLNVDNVRPYSPVQQELLKIYEDGIINSDIEVPDDILKISKTAQPTSSELQRYKLWLEQKYRSPYTGQFIPLGKLFTPEYEIEHIIPQSRYFDDSFSNKVICEAAVNRLKDNQLGLEFIKEHHGEKVQLGLGQVVEIFSEEDYQSFVKENYASSRSKRTKLLLEDIPESFTDRQMNDTRYISKAVKGLLSNVVREEGEQEVTSKNIVVCTGNVTTILKRDWGLDAVWNSLIISRFERMNQLTNSTAFTSWNEQYQKFLPTVPLKLSKGFQKKRIDHRHHAMDALAIACATRDHVNLLNNQYAKSETSRYDLQRKLRLFEPISYFDKKANKQVERKIPKEFIKPWDSFTTDARNELEKIVVSFKQNLRVINKTINKYQTYENGKKILKSQAKGDSWAIRKPLHKDTVFAKVSLQKIKKVKLSEALKNLESIVDKEFRNEIRKISATYGKFEPDKIDKHFKDRKYLYGKTDVSKVEIYYFETENAAVRKSLDISFTEKFIKESVADSGIQKIFLNYLVTKDNKPELAFSPEGIEEMNQNITAFNDGKSHQPIRKVRVYETIGNKFQVGYTGNKKAKYVEAAKGTNLFFAVYADDKGNRSYETVALNVVVERLKQGLSTVPERNEKGHVLLFHLSPNDLVYVPTEEELVSGIKWNIEDIKVDRIYKMVSSTGNQCFFICQNVANPIVNKVEFSPLNKMERGITGEMIKEICVKLNIDRLGNINLLMP